MAALQGQVQFGAGASVPLVATTAKTVVQLTAAANQRVKVLGYGFYFDGTSNSAQPVQIQMGRISASGTLTSATPLPNEQDLTETFQTTAGVNATVEPTYSGYLKTLTVHPQLGYEYLAPMGQEVILKGGGMLGFVVNAPAAVDVRGYVMIEE